MNDESAKKIADSLSAIATAINWVGFTILMAAGAMLFGLYKMC